MTTGLYLRILLTPWHGNLAFQVFTGASVLCIGVLLGFAILSYRHRGKLIAELHRKKRLEADRQAILEMIARRTPLSIILQRIARSISVNCPGALSGVIRVNDGKLEVASESQLPESFRRDLTSLSADRPFDELWASLLSAAARHGVRASRFAPIRSGDDELLGAITVFPRHGQEKETMDIECPTIRAMSNLAGAAIDSARLYERLARQAGNDSLTGLPNRLTFESQLQEALAFAGQHQRPLAVFFLDLDRFKKINDSLGHRIGDLFLQQVASRLSSAIPPGESLARIGGDEFTVLLRQRADPSWAAQIANRMLQVLRPPFVIDGHEASAGASIGISLYPQDGEDSAALLKHADTAMYRAKFRGKNCYQFFTTEDARPAGNAISLEPVLRNALENGGFQLHYQPQFSLDGELTGMEALLRLQHPLLGLLAPDAFLVLAEETRLIIPIGDWVIREACSQVQRWLREGFLVPKISVNMSSVEFNRGNCAGSVEHVIGELGIAPGQLELELTEASILADINKAANQMQRLKAVGVRIAIDHFGGAYSSLTHLHRLPVDTLKIDPSFIDGLDGPAGALPLMQAIVALARSLNMDVVAKSVERQSQHDLLRAMGCPKVQGSLFARPEPASVIQEAVRASARARTVER